MIQLGFQLVVFCGQDRDLTLKFFDPVPQLQTFNLQRFGARDFSFQSVFGSQRQTIIFRNVLPIVSHFQIILPLRIQGNGILWGTGKSSGLGVVESIAGGGELG